MRNRPTTICGAPFRPRTRTTKRDEDEKAEARGAPRQARPARGKHALFHREAGAAARRLAARADPHRAQRLAVLLSAEAAADDERRLRDLRALRDHEQAARSSGLITEGSMLEFLHSHSSVVFQPGFDDPRFSGLNPYALGFAMMSDIQRICDDPTEEDRRGFPRSPAAATRTGCCATPGPITGTKALSCSI